ncbi:MAG: hypothetical protein Q9198_008207 [Flavoplaca austrocitrina]
MGRIERIFLDRNHDPDFLWMKWVEVVETYTQRDLTIESDRLPALSGLASRFSNLWGCAYYAGLWEKKLMEGLCWFVRDPSTSIFIESYAPSWSWASLIGPVFHYDSPFDIIPGVESPAEFTSVVECKATPANGAAPFGQINDWSLTIEGFAQWIRWDGQEQIVAKGVEEMLYPNGIVAHARPDCSQLEVFCEQIKRDPGAPPPEDVEENIFYMGGAAAETNEITLPILVIVASPVSALMLCALNDDEYFRIGLLHFQGAVQLNRYFEVCTMKKVTVL